MANLKDRCRSTVLYPPTMWAYANNAGLVVSVAMLSKIMRADVMTASLPLSDRITDVRPGCKTPRQDESYSRLGVLSYQRN
ncbi:hypothetical protein PoB_004050500 [Plakobranchus ocellatus]|uniref:Uncharacterized protein n=1 Tax=Plakobranchus ocellatus TaxID=259542 RepID=A0AAV4B359_9GAST|nr:hypothetical protein PoB_004050500 [Plakobranchus ocellatus]